MHMEKITLPFTKKHADDILDRVKTQTARKRIDPRIRPGALVQAIISRKNFHFANLEIEDVYKKRLGDFDKEDAKREGGYTLEGFRKVWKQIYRRWDPDELVYVIRFKVVSEKVWCRSCKQWHKLDSNKPLKEQLPDHTWIGITLRLRTWEDELEEKADREICRVCGVPHGPNPYTGCY